MADLAELKARGAKPDPYELKRKYGYERLSEFFPLLEDIRVKTEVLKYKQFIGGIFSRVIDSRDLRYLYGPCDCEICKGD